jgi:hypothetical protein
MEQTFKFTVKLKQVHNILRQLRNKVAYMVGRAMTQAVSRLPVTAEATAGSSKLKETGMNHVRSFS